MTRLAQIGRMGGFVLFILASGFFGLNLLFSDFGPNETLAWTL